MKLKKKIALLPVKGCISLKLKTAYFYSNILSPSSNNPQTKIFQSKPSLMIHIC